MSSKIQSWVEICLQIVGLAGLMVAVGLLTGSAGWVTLTGSVLVLAVGLLISRSSDE